MTTCVLMWRLAVETTSWLRHHSSIQSAAALRSLGGKTCFTLHFLVVSPETRLKRCSVVLVVGVSGLFKPLQLAQRLQNHKTLFVESLGELSACTHRRRTKSDCRFRKTSSQFPMHSQQQTHCCGMSRQKFGEWTKEELLTGEIRYRGVSISVTLLSLHDTAFCIGENARIEENRNRTRALRFENNCTNG